MVTGSPGLCAEDNLRGCHLAGGIKLLSRPMKSAPQNPDWAQVSSRDLLAVPDLCPPPRLGKSSRTLSGRGNCAPSPFTRKFLPPVPAPPHTPHTPFPEISLASLLRRERLAWSGGGRGGGGLGLQRRGGDRCSPQLKEAKKKNLRKATVCTEKKTKTPHNRVHFGFATPTKLQPAGGRRGRRSCGFIAVEERTRKMLTAFMRCGINNNRLRLYCVL